jgi:hypothetical protein
MLSISSPPASTTKHSSSSMGNARPSSILPNRVPIRAYGQGTIGDGLSLGFPM